MVGVAYADWFGAKYQNECNAFPVFAVDPARYLDMYPEFTIDHAQRETFARTRTGAVAGKRLVDRFGWKIGQKLPISSEIHPKTDGEHELGVRPGRHHRRRRPGGARQHRHGPDQRGLLRRGRARSAAARPAGTSCASPTPPRPGPSRRRSTACFTNSPDETKTQPEKEFAIGFAKQIGDIGALVTRILIAVFFTHPHPDRQHHGPVHPRAHPGAGHSEDARLLGRQGHRAGARGGGAAARPGRGHRHGRRPPRCPRSTPPPAAASRRSSSASRPGSSPPLVAALAPAIGLPPALRAHRLKIVDALAGHAEPRRPCAGSTRSPQITLINLRNLPAADGHLAGGGRRHRGRGGRAGLGARDVGGISPHAGQHRARRSRDHAARRLRRGALERRRARPGRLLAALPGVARDAGGPPARLRGAGGDGGSAAQGRDRPQQRALPRSAAGRVRHPRRGRGSWRDAASSAASAR